MFKKIPNKTSTIYCLLSLILFVNHIKADICDLCICSECDSLNTTENSCSSDVDEFYLCDGNSEQFTKLNYTIDLNAVQWPNKNVLISAAFNHLKLTYLSK